MNNRAHHFCSRKCYSEFRSFYYVKERGGNYGKKRSKEAICKMRQNTLILYKNGVYNTNTKPQRITDEILKKLGVEYERERLFKYYSVDDYLIASNLIIEVMGDYFHSNPIRYNSRETLNLMQHKGIARDKRKHTYIKRYYDVEILYLWECDLLNNSEVCAELIKLYIKNNGILNNYNSFNYHIIYNRLELKENIKYPYFINRKSVETNLV
jgi:G:T-mismatch repair DNA endonuclease (very short patch repair protein)